MVSRRPRAKLKSPKTKPLHPGPWAASEVADGDASFRPSACRLSSTASGNIRSCPSQLAQRAFTPKDWHIGSKRSEAGDAGYDFVSEGLEWRFHKHLRIAIEEAHDKYLKLALVMAMGGVIYKVDPILLALGCQGPDAYLTDERGNPVPEVTYKPNGKMIRFHLEWKDAERWAND